MKKVVRTTAKNTKQFSIKRKLVKAQTGVADLPPTISSTGTKVFQGPLDQEVEAYLNTIYPSTAGSGKMPKNKKGSKLKSGKKIGPGTTEMYNRARAENDLRSRSSGSQDWYGPISFTRKKGGSVKNKHKK